MSDPEKHTYTCVVNSNLRTCCARCAYAGQYIPRQSWNFDESNYGRAVIQYVDKRKIQRLQMVIVTTGHDSFKVCMQIRLSEMVLIV